jgi:hypothetical protein
MIRQRGGHNLAHAYSIATSRASTTSFGPRRAPKTGQLWAVEKRPGVGGQLKTGHR